MTNFQFFENIKEPPRVLLLAIGRAGTVQAERVGVLAAEHGLQCYVEAQADDARGEKAGQRLGRPAAHHYQWAEEERGAGDGNKSFL